MNKSIQTSDQSLLLIIFRLIYSILKTPINLPFNLISFLINLISKCAINLIFSFTNNCPIDLQINSNNQLNSTNICKQLTEFRLAETSIINQKDIDQTIDGKSIK